MRSGRAGCGEGTGQGRAQRPGWVQRDGIDAGDGEGDHLGTAVGRPHGAGLAHAGPRQDEVSGVGGRHQAAQAGQARPGVPARRSPGPSPSDPPEPGSGLSTLATVNGRLRSWVTWWARTLPALPCPAR